MHFALNQRRHDLVIRNDQARYCVDCFQHKRKRGVSCFHIWAMISWNTKSELVFYGCDDEEAEKSKKRVKKAKKKGENPLAEDLKRCSGGKLTHQRCIDEILVPCVEPRHHICQEGGGLFVLQEDNDSSHGTAPTSNPVRAYKQRIGLNYYANPPSSPDFNPIENMWRMLKQRVKSHKCVTKAQLKRAILEK